MLLPFLFSQLLVLTIANPFHKYPYVFILDVGNEEIEKSEAEQIRLTVPGGSMAVKYPATGEGDLIGHVRVSGIDFGSDLKASIVEGGPGYKYVVIVFNGNPGNSYDAVVTIQTMANNEENDNSPNSEDDEDDVQEGDDNSIEETNDSGSMTVYSSGDSEVMQSSSNIYKYSVNSAVDSQNDENDDSNDDTNKQNNDNSDSNNESDDSHAKDSVSEKLSGKYTAFKPHFYGGVRFYPQAAVYTQSVYGESDDDNDVSVKDDGDNQSDRFKESKSYSEMDYALPVEY